MLASNGLWNPATEEFGSDLEAVSAAVSRHPPEALVISGEKGGLGGLLVGLTFKQRLIPKRTKRMDLKYQFISHSKEDVEYHNVFEHCAIWNLSCLYH